MPHLAPLLILFGALLLGGGTERASAASAAGDAACAGPCTIYVFKLGSGAGTVKSPEDATLNCGTSCELGTDYDAWVTLRASPSDGSVFTGWVGECEAGSAGGDCRVHMLVGPVRYYAVFDRIGDPPTPLREPGSGAAPAPQPPPPPFLPISPPEARIYGGCTQFGTAAADELDGTSGRDVFCAFGGDDHIHAGGGNDVVLGGAGSDVIETHGGNDRVEGGDGADTIHGGRGNDTLVGGAGRDRIYGETGGDTIVARDGAADLVHGGPGKDRARADKRDRLRATERRF